MVKRIEYVGINALGDDKAVCDRMVEAISSKSFIHFNEATLDLADDAVPVYYADLYANCADLAYYADMAQEEGLVPEDASIASRLSTGAYIYYRELINYNMYEILYNACIDYLLENYPRLFGMIEQSDIEKVLVEFGNYGDNKQLQECIEQMVDEYFLLGDMEEVAKSVPDFEI